MLELKYKKNKVKKVKKMYDIQNGELTKIENESTKLYSNPIEKTCELNSYNGYRTFYLEPGDGYNIGSLFAFSENCSIEDIEEKSFREMILRQNINQKLFLDKKEYIFSILPQFQKLIDEIKETRSPAFMPLLPPEPETGYDFQNLSFECLNNDQCKYDYIHKQIANSFDMARFQIARLTNKNVPEKWFLFGKDRTCTGLFRLWSLCPEKTSAVCCNSCIDDIVLPIMIHKNENMNYPFGFGNYKEITGIDGDDPELLSNYRDTDVLYIGNSFDLEKQKHEEQIRSKLKKFKFQHINIERYDGTKVVDFSYFYQFRSEIYKETFLGKLLKKISRKKEEILLLSSSPEAESCFSSKPVSSEQSEYFGQLSEKELEEYRINLEGVQKSSSGIAKKRLASVMAKSIQEKSMVE